MNFFKMEFYKTTTTVSNWSIKKIFVAKISINFEFIYLI
jgi:hypothetical protein